MVEKIVKEIVKFIVRSLMVTPWLNTEGSFS